MVLPIYTNDDDHQRVEGLHCLQRFYENEINRLGQTVAASIRKALLAKNCQTTRQIKKFETMMLNLDTYVATSNNDLDDG